MRCPSHCSELRRRPSAPEPRTSCRPVPPAVNRPERVWTPRCCFASSFLALRTLPLFVVQAGRASSLAVTAVLAVLVLRTRLKRVEIGAVVVVACGVVLLAAGAGTQRPVLVPLATRVGLLVAVF